MKLSKEIIEAIKSCKKDEEETHRSYDIFMRMRLKELDPEFVEEMDKLTEDIEFYYSF